MITCNASPIRIGTARMRNRGQDATRSPACENRVNMCHLLPNGNHRGVVLLCIRVPKIARRLRGTRRGHGMIRPGRRGAGTASLTRGLANTGPHKQAASQRGFPSRSYLLMFCEVRGTVHNSGHLEG